ncbi:hypothetical protein QQP08_011563 [Theobroma cacao]|nr:hypothetical protein QQP08_011563 [Theobroma cacao]
MASWAKKLSRPRVTNCRFRLRFSSPASISCPPKPLEVVLAANLGRTKCQKRVADAISRIDDVESVVVHVLQRKVTVTRQPFRHGSSGKRT